jgi:hypothetical protein
MFSSEDESAKSGEIPALSRNGNPAAPYGSDEHVGAWPDQVSPVA